MIPDVVSPLFLVISGALVMCACIAFVYSFFRGLL